MNVKKIILNICHSVNIGFRVVVVKSKLFENKSSNPIMIFKLGINI